ncbi:hypothetical protein KIO74_30215 [Chelatococcus sp. HY11]|nr:hypothetical protein [Chelatococcus sp. HY11]
MRKQLGCEGAHRMFLQWLAGGSAPPRH